MTEKGFITANSGDTEVAGTLSIAAPRALYAVASGHKPKKNPEELLPASPADRGSGIRLIKSEDRKKDDILNRPGRSTYPREKSVLTSGATCVAVNSAMYADSVEPTALQAQFADATRVINQIADVLAEGEGRSAVAAYGTVLLFTDLIASVGWWLGTGANPSPERMYRKSVAG